jgi:hypothetical protein
MKIIIGIALFIALLFVAIIFDVRSLKIDEDDGDEE